MKVARIHCSYYATVFSPHFAYQRLQLLPLRFVRCNSPAYIPEDSTGRQRVLQSGCCGLM